MHLAIVCQPNLSWETVGNEGEGGGFPLFLFSLQNVAWGVGHLVIYAFFYTEIYLIVYLLLFFHLKSSV